MPIQEPVKLVRRIIECHESTSNNLDKNTALLLLREREVLAYHYICSAFRAQGHLTPEKLKFLKEIAAALYITDSRHRAECEIVVNDRELTSIADCVAGPGTEVEWQKEGLDMSPAPIQGRINPAALQLANAVAKAVQAEQEKMSDSDEPSIKTIKINSKLFKKFFNQHDQESSLKMTTPASNVKLKEEIKEEIKEEEVDEDKDGGNLCSSLSSASDDSHQSDEELKSEEIVSAKEETDSSLMPPPPPLVNVPYHTTASSSASLLSPQPVMAASSPSGLTVVTSSGPTTITVPVEISTNIQTHFVEQPIIETPVLSETDQAQALAQAQAEFLSSLPPLVVVPPPEPLETSATHSPSPSSPAIMLSPGMSIQLRDDTNKRKRSLTQDCVGVTKSPGPKTMAVGNLSKVTPMMVSTSASTVASSQGQIKVTPIASRAKMTTTPQTQKVIIVSNTQTPNTPILQRSLGVPMGTMGLPIIRANQPRLHQQVPVSGQSSIRPKMVTVPAKCRGKGSNMVSLQLKNAITLKQDNITVVDTNVKRLTGPTKILPKPSGSMFIVNTGHGTQRLATAVAGGRRGASEGTKQNVVIVQKGGNQRTLTLSNNNKDLMQKLMSKKCVVIQSSKVVPKTISSKPTPPPALPPVSSAGNVVVLDLSQEQYRQSLGGTTLAEILQASGFIPPTTQTMPAQTSTQSETVQVSSGEGEWLPVETSKSLSLEEVTMPLGQSETFVTLDEAVEMLDQQTISEIPVSEGSFTSANTEQVLTLIPEQLGCGDLTMVADNPKSMARRIVVKTCPAEVATSVDCVTQTLRAHKDGAVTIQHSNFDVPTNMSLEEYSSQQMEN